MSIAKAHTAFRVDITALFFLDQRTQSGLTSFTSVQTATINEAILVRAFRAYENLLESVFLEYVQGKPTLSNLPVVSYLAPRDTDHAYSLIKSSQAFLEWNKPDQVIQRAETYLGNGGGPIKPVIASKQSVLTDIRKIRNHIAHNSRMSSIEYRKVVQHYLQTLPLTIPTPGDFLQHTKPKSKHTILRYFLDELADTANALVT